MRVFLTGNRDLEWRWDIAAFLAKQQVDFFDPSDYSPEFSSIFKQLKILEGCDLLIAYFAGLQTHPLMSMLEVSYASKLAKEVMVVDNIPREKSWVRFLPYSMSFPDLDGLKDYLARILLFSKTRPRFLG